MALTNSAIIWDNGTVCYLCAVISGNGCQFNNNTLEYKKRYKSDKAWLGAVSQARPMGLGLAYETRLGVPHRTIGTVDALSGLRDINCPNISDVTRIFHTH